MVRRIAVRKTNIYQHHGGPIKGVSQFPPTSRQYGMEGLKGGPRLAPH